MQFCIKCGKELPSDAVFCPKCGEKAVISKAEIVEANNNSLERNVKVDAASLNKLGVTKTAFANRVEASDDPMVNERLFTLYGKLIAPVSKIEQLTDLVKKCKGEIKRRKEVCFLMPGIKCILILSVIVSIVLMMVEESLTVDLSEEFKNNPVLFEQYEGSFCTYYLDNGCPLILKPAVAIARIGLDVELNSAKDLFLFLSTAMFLQGLVYVLVVLFLISLLVYLIRIFVNKREIQKLEDIVSDAIDERSEIIRRIQNYICYVPPSYRTSEALAYFVHAYGNTKVNNLKEAVNSYSDAVGTESIKRAISNMCRELDGIQTVQLRTSEQIYSMNADIWREDYNF